MVTSKKKDMERARNLALKWAYGKCITLKNVGPSLPNLIANELVRERYRAIKRIYAMQEKKHAQRHINGNSNKLVDRHYQECINAVRGRA